MQDRSDKIRKSMNYNYLYYLINYINVLTHIKCIYNNVAINVTIDLSITVANKVNSLTIKL